VQRLNRLDALITPSAGAGEVWCRLGVRSDRIHTLPLARSDVERLQPKSCLRPAEPLRFAILNGASSAEKGADLIVDALSELARRGLEHRFRLTVHGLIPAHVRAAFAGQRSVVTAGEYRPGTLDQILDEVDVGLMPSVWQEVYGFAGIEFLAKGIPVIGNALGGIPEYVRPGETGWLNTSCSAQELADLMESAIDHPNEVQRLGESVVRLRDQLVKPCQTHLADLGSIYAKVMSARRPPHPDRALGAPSR
jgi:glycosyltransferase involved in cell wall biosynthesis